MDLERYHAVVITGGRELYGDRVSVMIKFTTEEGKVTYFPGNCISVPEDGRYTWTSRDDSNPIAFLAGMVIPEDLEADERPVSFRLNSEFLIPLLEAAIASGQIEEGCPRAEGVYSRDDGIREYYRHLWTVHSPDGDTILASSYPMDAIHVGNGCKPILKEVAEYGIVLLYSEDYNSYGGAIVRFNEADYQVVKIAQFTGPSNYPCPEYGMDDSIREDDWDIIFTTNDLEEAERILEELADHIDDEDWLDAHHIILNSITEDYWAMAFGLGWYDPRMAMAGNQDIAQDDADDWGDGNEDDWDDSPADDVDPTLTIFTEE